MLQQKIEKIKTKRILIKIENMNNSTLPTSNYPKAQKYNPIQNGIGWP